jgi:rhodanese-related sulfurtransferase
VTSHQQQNRAGLTPASETDAIFAGDLTPTEAWDLLSTQPKAQLVDVRTEAEWASIGIADLQKLGKSSLCISWRELPGMTVNESFFQELSSALKQRDLPHNIPLLFLCKTGGRSTEAAHFAAEQGYGPCYNIANGMEGDADASGERGNINGWKASNLPWGQK